MDEKLYKKTISDLKQEIVDLKVVIDTAQTALRSVDSILKHDLEKHKEVFTTSAKWALNYKI